MNANRTLTTFGWLLKREFWEYRGGFMRAPLIVTAFVLLFTMLGMVATQTALPVHGINVNGVDIDKIVGAVTPEQLEQVRAGIQVSLISMSMPITITFFFVVLFYCLGALYNDRSDRSVLFWKSLPVSDTATVASKVVAALIVAPVFAVAGMIVLHLGFLILVCSFLALHGLNAFTTLFSPTNLVSLWAHLIAMIPLDALWALPSVGWLLLCSSFVRSRPFLWAFAVPIVVGWMIAMANLLQHFAIPSSWYWRNIAARVLFGLFPVGMLTPAWGGNPLHIHLGDDHAVWILRRLMGTESIWSSLATPDIWIGAAAGLVMIAAAVYFRRVRSEAHS